MSSVGIICNGDVKVKKLKRYAHRSCCDLFQTSLAFHLFPSFFLRERGKIIKLMMIAGGLFASNGETGHESPWNREWFKFTVSWEVSNSQSEFGD